MFKNKFKILAVLLALVLSLGIFAACGTGEALDGKLTIIVRGAEDKTFTADLKEGGFTTKDHADDVMKYLNKQDETFTYTGSFSVYGIFVTSVCGLEPEGNQYIATYTSVEKDKSTYDGATTLTVNGKTLFYSGVGLSEMTLENGAIILFVMESY